MKVVKVKFKESGEEFFFTSYTAIYQQFTSDDLVVVIGSIWNKVRKEGKYENNNVVITSHPLKAKKREL